MSLERPRHLLILDDDPEIQALLKEFLLHQGFRVSTASDGRGMRRILDEWDLDLIILDIMLPGEDGLSLCRYLRQHFAQIPIIMLTAMASEADRVVGLEMGADDYLVKPFSARELLARMRAIWRRSPGIERPTLPTNLPNLCFAGWIVDQGRRELYTQDRVLVPLSSGEYALLLTFLHHPQQILSRDILAELTRGHSALLIAHTPLFDRSIDIQISRLRRKLEDHPKAPSLIKTVRGEGYIFAAPVQKI
jgi:two-component system, OmpR family, response regulator